MIKCFFKCGLPACKIGGCQLHQAEVNSAITRSHDAVMAHLYRQAEESLRPDDERIRRIVREEIAKGGK